MGGPFSGKSPLRTGPSPIKAETEGCLHADRSDTLVIVRMEPVRYSHVGITTGPCRIDDAWHFGVDDQAARFVAAEGKRDGALPSEFTEMRPAWHPWRPGAIGQGTIPDSPAPKSSSIDLNVARVHIKALPMDGAGAAPVRA